MKTPRLLMATAFGLAAGAATAQNCPWAGGDYAFSDHGIYGDFSVNADCTALEWLRIANSPETSDLTRTDDGWAGKLSKATFVLRNDGQQVQLTGIGGPSTRSRVKRKN